MPELPEVEIVCRGLQNTILNQTITGADNLRPNLRIPFPDDFSERLDNKRVVDIKRRAKYILMTIEDGTVVIAHLGMSGKLVVYNNRQNERKKHDHAVFWFDDGKEMVFNDARRFGLITFAEAANVNSHKLIGHLGVEPLSDAFNGQVLHNLLSRKATPIKNTIMDASLVVGVGNIYACEALFRSGISPVVKANSISADKCEILVANIKKVLLESIESGGSTLKDYVQSSGDAGYFQHSFKVYGREGESCVSCGERVQRIKQSGRSTFYCQACQR